MVCATSISLMLIAAFGLVGLHLPEFTVLLYVAAVVLLVCVVGLQLYLLHKLKSPAQADTVLKDVLQADPLSAIVTDGSGRVTWSNTAAQSFFKRKTESDISVALLFENVVLDADACVARLLRRASEAKNVCSDVIEGPDKDRLTVQRCGLNSFLWRLLDRDRIKDMIRVIEKITAPAIIVEQSGFRLLSVNSSAQKLIPQSIQYLPEIFETRQIKFGMVSTLLTQDGPREMFAIHVASDDTAMAVIFAACPQHSVDDPINDQGFHKIPVPLLKLAINGDLLMANEAARRLLDITSVQNINLRDLMNGLGQSLTEWLNRSALGVHQPNSEFLRLTRGETETFLQVTLSRIMEKSGPQLFAVLTDATALKTLEGQFVQSQKLQAIGQLAGGVAHDFNNLLTAISGYCDLLLLRHDPTDQDYPDLIEIHENANRAASLIDQLLAFSRKQTLRPQNLNLQDVMSDLTHLLNRLLGEKVALRLRQGAMKCHVRADKRQVEQVIMNLVVNARDAMPAGGDVTIETSVLRLTKALERDRAVVSPGEYISVKVIDQGMGIKPNVLPKIFEPFYTTKPMGEGTGLGLSMVYGIMKQSGGYIFVDSVLGQSSCFTLLFPAHQGVVDDSYTLADPVTKETLPARAKGVVLLVEDEAPVRAFAVRALQLRGYTVLEADGGERALEILQDPDQLVDIFVTDVIMPGLDGPAWVRRALKSRPGTKVIFMSGYACNFLDDEACETFQSVFLPKPFSLTDLSQAVQQQLSEAAQLPQTVP